MAALTLYRPVGVKELKLIAELDWRGFPPRLPEQPIFYPVLNETYAQQISRDWNAKDEGTFGFVTKFDVECNYIDQFERQFVGGKQYEELWIPAEQLEEFNKHIIGSIIVTRYYRNLGNGPIENVVQIVPSVKEIDEWISLEGSVG